MSTHQTWIVCEHSGRWAAALRVALARLPCARFAPRLYEVRSLADLTAHLNVHPNSLALIEVRQANLADVFELLAHGRAGRQGWFAALLDQGLWQEDRPFPSPDDYRKRQIVEVIWEAGAVEVVESPRQLRGLLALGDRLAAVAGSTIGRAAEGQSVADWAWSTLPWQDP